MGTPAVRRKLLMLVGAVAVVAAVVIGLSQTNTDNSAPKSSTISAQDARRALAGAPAPLAELHAQGGDLLDGSRTTVAARIKALRGHPIVVNKWASWCGPCRYEFPFLQEASVRYGRRVAFLGLNSGDNRGDAQSFLKRFPVSYPSYVDPHERIATSLDAGAAYPTTIFYDAQGRRQFIHQGGYATRAKLEQDVERYALGQGA
jgi:cytochrome c biogenesis protein CcmG, thiol:disulfide interchange protein DsbE